MRNLLRAESVVRCALVGALVSAAGSAVCAQTPAMLKDINPTAPTVTGNADPIGLTKVGNRIFFFANFGPQIGFELGVTDGTSAGTSMVKEINPGPNGILPNFGGNTGRGWSILPMPDDTILFWASDGTHSYELWRSDGTEAGTYMVKDIRPGILSCIQDSIPIATQFPPNYFFWPSSKTDMTSTFPLVRIGNTAYFCATDGTHKMDVYKTDGTAAGTARIGFINDGTTDGQAVCSTMMVYNGKVILDNFTTAGGLELFSLDPADDSITPLPQMAPGAANGYFAQTKMAILNGDLYLCGSTNGTTGEMFKYDTLGNLTMATNIGTINPDGSPATTPALGIRQQFTPTLANGKIFVIGNRTTNPAVPEPQVPNTGTELWVHDPAAPLPNATCINLCPDPYTGTGGNGVLGAPSFPRFGIELNGKCYFIAQIQAATVATSEGWELYSSDGTPAGTSKVKDLIPGLPNGGIGIYAPATSSNANLGTVNWPNPLFTFNNRLYFGGSAVGTTTGVGTFNNTNFTATGYATRLYTSDGTNAGTVPAESAASGVTEFAQLTPLDATTMIFVGVNTANGRELFKIVRPDNESPAVISLVKDLATVGTFSSNPAQFTDVPGRGVFFTATNGTNGIELWKTDGSATGTVMVKDTIVGATSGNPNFLVPVGDKLFFTATATGNGFEVHTSDGTLAGTNMVRDMNIGTGNGVFNATVAPATVRAGREVPLNFVELGGKYIYSGLNGTPALPDVPSGREVFMSDGTSGGTGLLFDIHAGLNGTGQPNSAFGFLAADNVTFTPPNPFWKIGGHVYFSAYDTVHALEQGFTSVPSGVTGGGELWRTDGTALGTVSMASIDIIFGDINPGPAGSDPHDLTAITNANMPAGSFVFFANDGGTGDELWSFHAGTQSFSLVLDINSTAFGRGSYAFWRPVVINGVAYFSADDGVSGRKLWRTDGTTAGTFMVIDTWPGPTGSTPGPFVVMGNKLLYDADNGTTGFELYAYDTTQPVGPDNPHFIGDLFPGPGSGATGGGAVFNGKYYFPGNNGASGVEPFVTDAISMPTLAADIFPGVFSSVPTLFFATSTDLYFVANNGTAGNELYSASCKPTFNGTTGGEASVGGTASITVGVTSANAITSATFRRNGNAITPGGRFSVNIVPIGPTTNYNVILTINPVEAGDAGSYDALVDNGCGPAAPSPAASLAVVVNCNPADIVSVGQLPPPDGQLSADDFLAFFGAYFAGNSLADIVAVGGLPPPDGSVSADDFLGFLNFYFQGC